VNYKTWNRERRSRKGKLGSREEGRRATATASSREERERKFERTVWIVFVSSIPEILPSSSPRSLVGMSDPSHILRQEQPHLPLAIPLKSRRAHEARVRSSSSSTSLPPSTRRMSPPFSSYSVQSDLSHSQFASTSDSDLILQSSSERLEPTLLMRSSAGASLLLMRVRRRGSDGGRSFWGEGLGETI